MGKLIVIEGTDGSGKSTQLKMLTDHLTQDQVEFKKIVFPRYSEESSALIRMYLGGQFGGNPNDVSAYAASTFYGVDRFASYKMDWGSYYENGGLVVSDRYTTSNAVHQTSKEPAEKQADFLNWLYDFEYSKLSLPKPDLVICLDMPTELSLQLMRQREENTNTTADIHEKNAEYLAACRKTAGNAAKFYGWQVVSCAKDGKIRTAEDIHEEIFGYVRALLED